MNDATILARDIVGDAATKAAARVRPSQEELNQIDRPADDNVWYDSPNLSKESLKHQLKSSVGKPASDALGDASQAAHPEGSRDHESTAHLVTQNGTSAVDAQSGLQAGAATLQQRVSDNIPDEHKDKARDTKQRTLGYLSTKMPEERREQTIWRLKKMIVEIQGHPDCEHALGPSS